MVRHLIQDPAAGRRAPEFEAIEEGAIDRHTPVMSGGPDGRLRPTGSGGDRDPGIVGEGGEVNIVEGEVRVGVEKEVVGEAEEDLGVRPAVTRAAGFGAETRVRGVRIGGAVRVHGWNPREEQLGEGEQDTMADCTILFRP